MHTFEGKEHSVLELKSLFLHSLYDWMWAMRGLSFSTFIEFIDLWTPSGRFFFLCTGLSIRWGWLGVGIWGFIGIFTIGRWRLSLSLILLILRYPRGRGMTGWHGDLVGVAALGKILTIDKLIKRGVSLLNWCCMCWRNREMVNHLLIHFDVSSTL